MKRPAVVSVLLMFWVLVVDATLMAQEIVALAPVVPFPEAAAGSTSGGAAPQPANPLAQYAPVITESLRITLTNAGFNVRTVNTPENFPGIWQEAKAAGAKIVVFGTAALAEDRLVIQLSAYEVNSRQIISGSVTNGRIDLSLYNTIDAAVGELSSKMLAWVTNSPLTELRANGSFLRSLSLQSADEGARVYLAGGELLGTIKGGKFTTSRLSVPIGSTISVEKRKAGYISQWETIRITRAEEKVTLSALWPVTTIATDLMWTLGFPVGGGIGLRFFPKPDWIFVGLNYNLSVQPATFGGGNSATHFLMYGGLGAYLFWGPTSHFRFSVSAGYGASTTYLAVPGAGSFLDGYISFLNPTFYANFRRFYGFVRTNFWFVVPSSNGLLAEGDVGNHGAPPVTFGVGYKW